MLLFLLLCIKYYDIKFHPSSIQIIHFKDNKVWNWNQGNGWKQDSKVRSLYEDKNVWSWNKGEGWKQDLKVGSLDKFIIELIVHSR
jgi:hypothetical protein